MSYGDSASGMCRRRNSPTIRASCCSVRASVLLLPLLLYIVAAAAALTYGVVGAEVQLTISATTPSAAASSATPNTFIGTVGNQIAASLLASNTPALLWGSVSADDINAACHYIVDTGSLTLTASVSNDWGGSEDLTVQVQATGGCLAASDASGTEFVFTDNYGRKSVVVCPSNAGSSGCGVYVTGDDVNNLYNSFNNGGSKRRMLGMNIGRRMLADDCQSGAAEGAITGAVTGILGTAECLALGPLAPFCIIGVVGVSAELGAAGGCIASCFPGDATVQTRHGPLKHMSQLDVGDEIAVWGEDNRLTYQPVYAFGHKDATAMATFLEITVEPVVAKSTSDVAAATRTLRLTPMHFLPSATATANNVSINHIDALYKRSQDIKIGDIVWAAKEQQEPLSPCLVKEISVTRSQGLYNPLTMSGTIVVDGVVASVHSEWFLDPFLDAMGLTHWLPSTYQILLSPVRMLYRIMGDHTYIATYKWLDDHLDIPTFGTNYGAHVSMATLGATTIPLLMALLKMCSRKNVH
ncbi:hypothetical protein GOP47_0007912 [Adiantum capillus-veneris]|uniref:Hint domain-containing protein n=2 Tax=Adiantum capillus-veneris TaxID=13818 RepID=A0A9D4ZLE9_ADICA|nr:hypothetical protein GOP47_0007325 [Adiantum capillus-veneris]KAI5078088.1 hypothetical protein GOP47_0007912 [Adiantum capillus-veneris]